MAHLDVGRRILDRLTKDLRAVGLVDRNPLLEGRFITMIFSPDHVALKRIEQDKERAARAAAKAANQQPKQVETHGQAENA